MGDGGLRVVSYILYIVYCILCVVSYIYIYYYTLLVLYYTSQQGLQSWTAVFLPLSPRVHKSSVNSIVLISLLMSWIAASIQLLILIVLPSNNKGACSAALDFGGVAKGAAKVAA